jgi:M6 family metalloprotease-like protein
MFVSYSLSCLSLWLCFAAVAGAQVPARLGQHLPDAYYQRLRQDPQAFTFQHSFLALVQRVRENNFVMSRASNEFAMAAAVLNGGVTVGGTKLLPVLLAESTDAPNPPYASDVLMKAYFDGDGLPAQKPTGTLNDFYAAMSYGNLNVKGVVLDWKKLSHPVDWYAATDDTPAENCNALCIGNRVPQLIQELLAMNPGVDWGQFDNDGPDRRPNSGDDDGLVDFIVIVHPGIGAECGPASPDAPNPHIWSHRSHLAVPLSTPTNSARPEGGKIAISDYVIVPALDCDGVHMNPIGVVAHEFGHAFGLPDLYDLSQPPLTTVGGVGNWDLMATGGWGGDDISPQLPAEMSAWSKEFLNWVQPLPVTRDIPDIALNPIYEIPMAYKIPGPGNTYFLLSNRQQEGYDARLPNHGLLLETINQTQIDAGMQDDVVNSTLGNLGVQVFEADGATWLTNFIDPPQNSKRASAGDLLPTSAAQNNLDANSNPPSPGSFAICGIHEVSHVFHARLLVSTSVCPPMAISVPAPAAVLVPGQLDAALAEHALPLHDAQATQTPPLQPAQKTQASQDHLEVNLGDVLAHPELFNSRTVTLKGQLSNTGGNYFTHLDLRLTDATGRTISAAMNVVTSVVPPPANNANAPRPAVLSDLFDKSVTVTGTIESRVNTGTEKTVVLHINNVQSTP